MKKRKILSVRLLLVCIMVMLLPMTAFAENNRVKVKKVEVDQDNDDRDKYNTEIEINFTSRVVWRSNAKITSIKDSTGKSYTGILTDKDDDECEVYIKNLKYGRTYTIKISGVRARGASSYETITVKVKVPAQKKTPKAAVKKVEVDQDNDDHDKYKTEIEIKFASRVNWSSYAKITSVTDSTGKSYTGFLNDLDDDECEVYIRNLKYGRTYTIKISGVRAKGASSYETITVKVKVPAQKKTSKVAVKKVEVDDDDRYPTDVDIEFTSKVTWSSNAKVISVKDSNGRACTGILMDTDDDECEVYIKNLKSGRTYTIQISGVKARGASSYETITVKVKVP